MTGERYSVVIAALLTAIGIGLLVVLLLAALALTRGVVG